MKLNGAQVSRLNRFFTRFESGESKEAMAKEMKIHPASLSAFTIVVRRLGIPLVRTRADSVRKPVAAKPAAKKPVAAKPAAKKPVAAKPAAKKPVAAKPAAKKPVAAKPAAKKPVAAKPAAKPVVTPMTTMNVTPAAQQESAT